MKYVPSKKLLLTIPFLVLFAHYLIVFSFGNIELQLNVIDINSILLFSIVIFLFSFIEEFIFRGVLLDAFSNSPQSIFLNSVLFSLLHIFNAGFFPVAFIVTFLISAILCLIKIHVGFKQCVYIHFFWNWVVAILFSDNLSGISITKMQEEFPSFLINSTIFQLSYIDSFWFGSSYGLENGMIALLFLIAGITLMIKTIVINHNDTNSITNYQ